MALTTTSCPDAPDTGAVTPPTCCSNRRVPLLVSHSPNQLPRIEGEARGYGPELVAESARVYVEGSKLTLETDLFASHPMHVLVRDGQLWAADSLHRLTRMPEVPRGLLPLGICAALCNAPARRPSLCISGLSLLPATRTVSDGGKIHTTALGLPENCRGDIYVAPTEALKIAVQSRASGEAHVLFADAWAEPLLEALRERGIAARAWIVARSGLDVSTLSSRAEQLGAEPEIVNLPEEDLPPHADDAIRACETLISDSSPVASFAFFRQARVPAIMSAVGASEMFSDAVVRDGLPDFVARLQPECELAHFFLRPEWAKRVQRHDWRKEFAGKDVEAARELRLRTLLPHHTLPELVLTARAHGVDVRLPYLDRDVVALRGDQQSQLRRVPDFAKAMSDKSSGGQPAVLSSRARRDWILWLDARLSFDRLERLEVIDSGKVRRELIQYGKLHTEAPRRVLLERVFFKLASLTVLQEHWC